MQPEFKYIHCDMRIFDPIFLLYYCGRVFATSKAMVCPALSRGRTGSSLSLYVIIVHFI